MKRNIIYFSKPEFKNPVPTSQKHHVAITKI
jgi:hypothetical protein